MKTQICILIILSLSILGSCGKDKCYPDITVGIQTSDICELNIPFTDECGYIIYDPLENKTVKAWNLQKSFIPASVTKLFTAVFSFEMLKPDFRYSTQILYSGSINNEILNGSLILKGGGDPELSINDLINMIGELKHRGVKSVNGQFIYDIGLFGTRKVLNESMPVNAKYNPGFGPLNLNGNTIYALKKTDEKGKLQSCNLIPSLPSNRAYLYDGPHILLYAKYSEHQGVESWGLPSHGKWGNRLPLPVKNSALFTSFVFRKLCSIHGITMPFPEKGATPDGAKIIATHRSRTLDCIIKDMLLTSDNLASELIGTMAFREFCKGSRYNNSPIESFFIKSFPSISWEEFRIANYSGLTDMNRATPEQTVAMLIYLSKLELLESGISGLLPLSGLNGTMKTKLDSPDTTFRVYAKTGSIYYASALAGEFIAASGRKYLFTVYIDNKEKRKQYAQSDNNNIEGAAIAEKWSADAAKAIELFITKQINQL